MVDRLVGRGGERGRLKEWEGVVCACVCAGWVGGGGGIRARQLDAITNLRGASSDAVEMYS